MNGVICRHQPTLDHLAGIVRNFDHDMGSLRQQNEQTTIHLKRPNAISMTRAASTVSMSATSRPPSRPARDRTRELEASTFWRMTKPLRFSVHQVRASGPLRPLDGAPGPPRARPPFGHAPDRQGPGVGEVARRVRAKLFLRRTLPTGLRPRASLEPIIDALQVRSSDAPQVSVIVPTYGQDLHTFTCLKAVRKKRRMSRSRFIVMDDCAPEPARQMLHG